MNIKELAQAVATFQGASYSIEGHFNPSNIIIENALIITEDKDAFDTDVFNEDTVYFDEDRQVVSFYYATRDGDVFPLEVTVKAAIPMLNGLVENVACA